MICAGTPSASFPSLAPFLWPAGIIRAQRWSQVSRCTVFYTLLVQHMQRALLKHTVPLSNGYGTVGEEQSTIARSSQISDIVDITSHLHSYVFITVVFIWWRAKTDMACFNTLRQSHTFTFSWSLYFTVCFGEKLAPLFHFVQHTMIKQTMNDLNDHLSSFSWRKRQILLAVY